MEGFDPSLEGADNKDVSNLGVHLNDEFPDESDQIRVAMKLPLPYRHRLTCAAVQSFMCALTSDTPSKSSSPGHDPSPEEQKNRAQSKADAMLAGPAQVKRLTEDARAQGIDPDVYIQTMREKLVNGYSKG